MSINTILPISVNVQELFRATELLSRFTISPATLVPIQLTNCSIDGGDQYEVEAGIEIRRTLGSVPKATSQLGVSIHERSSAPSRQARLNPYLYSWTTNASTRSFFPPSRHAFSTEINSSPFAHLSHLLTSHLLEAYRTKWTEQDLEVALLLREISIWPFSEINWDEILRGLPSHCAEGHPTLAPILARSNSTHLTRQLYRPNPPHQHPNRDPHATRRCHGIA